MRYERRDCSLNVALLRHCKGLTMLRHTERHGILGGNGGPLTVIGCSGRRASYR